MNMVVCQRIGETGESRLKSAKNITLHHIPVPVRTE